MANMIDSWLVQHPTREGTVNVMAVSDYLPVARERDRLYDILRHTWEVHVLEYAVSQEERDQMFREWLEQEMLQTW